MPLNGGVRAGQGSLERSALAEAAEQFTRALKQIAALPATPTVRREQIKLQVALINPLMHVKGYGAPETKAASEQARLLIEQAEALGEPARTLSECGARTNKNEARDNRHDRAPSRAKI